MEKAVELTSTFSTSDAEYPENFAFDNGVFTLSFKNANEELVTVVFFDTLAFRWEEMDEDEDELLPEDGSYEIFDSNWLFQKSASTPDILSYRHFRLCFNEIGNFEILCKRYETTTEDISTLVAFP